MDTLKKTKEPSFGESKQKVDANEKLQHEFYCESQIVNDSDENENEKRPHTEKKKNRFLATYNIFF